MNKDLGEKQKRIRISLGLVMPLLYPVIGLLMLGFVVSDTEGDGTSTLSQVLSVIVCSLLYW